MLLERRTGSQEPKAFGIDVQYAGTGCRHETIVEKESENAQANGGGSNQPSQDTAKRSENQRSFISGNYPCQDGRLVVLENGGVYVS